MLLRAGIRSSLEESVAHLKHSGGVPAIHCHQRTTGVGKAAGCAATGRRNDRVRLKHLKELGDDKARVVRHREDDTSHCLDHQAVIDVGDGKDDQREHADDP